MTDYSNLSKEELIARLNALEKPSASAANATLRGKGKKEKPMRPFDFSKHSCRPVAFKVAYLGWKYHGLASQEGGSNVPTIESELFKALHTARLIPETNGRGCGWSRCGRTDKGVSSFGQVVACVVRSNLPKGAKGTCEWPMETNNRAGKRKRESEDDDEEGGESRTRMEGVQEDEDSKEYIPIPDDFEEIPFVSRLNHLLPPDIRILAWSPTSPQFDSRFDCTYRRYRYFFPSEGLDLAKMQEAAKKYIGTKDYRHFCKVDPSKNVKSYVRTVLDASVEPLVVAGTGNGIPTYTNFEVANQKGPVPPDSFLVFEVKGHAFLWHQVRCMTAILHLIGRGLEPVDLIDDMTDLSKHPENSGRPIYGMASEIPLVLVECGFGEGVLDWRVDGDTAVSTAGAAGISTAFRSSDAFTQLITGLWEQWREHSIQAAQVQSLLQMVAMDSFNHDSQVDLRNVFMEYGKEGVLGNASMESGGFGGKSNKAYIPVMKRKRCDSIEERTVKYNESKKGKKGQQ
ncbi:UNVERIFIED_CONTAM: tRNA pseudouridine synthase 3 [Siphonaria sp. JEL0065]|nr:tRNA pseudouridine synthase 3 [Siphonaria sp. JEL0065]